MNNLIIKQLLRIIMQKEMPKGMKWRLIVTIYGGIGFLIFLISFLAFYPTNFSILENLAIFFIALLVWIGVLIGVWMPWGMENWKECEKWGESFDKKKPSRKSKK